MNTKRNGIAKTGIVFGGVALILIASLVWWFFWSNDIKKAEIDISNRLDAQSNVVETALDTTCNTIKNMMNCSREHAEQVLKVVAAQTEGRKGGGLFKSNKESEALGLTPELYTKVANAVESQLGALKSAQDIQTDIWREHKSFCENPYHNMLFVSMEDKIEPMPEVISTAATKEAMETKVFNGDLTSTK